MPRSDDGRKEQIYEPITKENLQSEEKDVAPDEEKEKQTEVLNDVIQQKSYADFLKLNQPYQEWVSGKAIDTTKLIDIPIWIQFPNLQMKYWSLSGLSKLGSLIGKPIKRDKATATKAKWNFSRIQVEVQVHLSFPEKIQFVDEDERVITQEVTYEWKPTLCEQCKKLGHESLQCRRKEKEQKAQGGGQRKIWVPKQKQEERDVAESGEQKDSTEENLIPKQSNEKDQDGFQTGISMLVLNVEDIKGGNPITSDEIQDFKECIEDCGLDEIPSDGPYHTWSNKQKGDKKINPNKSQVVLGGVKPQQQDSLLKLTGMGRGKLPFTYLGSPVTTSHLKSLDCDRLVAKLTAKINAWNSKHLSYCAKIRLINAMLMGVITFWTRIFILPKMVLKKIMSICRNFLWGGAADYSKSPLVSWDIICQPKSKGGLGLRNIINWNKATIMKLNWDIANKKDVLWVKWIHSRYIQSASYWDYIPKPSSCHYWRQMVRVRDKFREMQLVGEFEVKKGYEWLQGELQRVGWANWV
ncbi:unnamed protein product [Cuscuta campestris]|uniref:Uncharacterized protein n=1 Tax=Cuscuta campestris TaxID=132261 RepID=A0A484KHU1_9ASTE|nr:unnamed protein product [Cuscuta campestris]